MPSAIWLLQVFPVQRNITLRSTPEPGPGIPQGIGFFAVLVFAVFLPNGLRHPRQLCTSVHRPALCNTAVLVAIRDRRVLAAIG
jgi:hypothetical protein